MNSWTTPSRALPWIITATAATAAIVLSVSMLRAQDILWTATYGDAEGDYGFAAAQTADGGYIIVGETYSAPVNGLSDLWLIKTNGDGSLEWERRFGGPLFNTGYAVQQTFDGGYIVAGTMQVPNANALVYVIRTDAAGDSLWTRTFGSRFTIDSGQAVVQTMDGGFAIAGWIRKPTPINNDDLYLIRLDSLGATVWTQEIGGDFRDRAFSIELTVDGGFVLAGETGAGATNAGNAWIVKTDSVGSVEWEKYYGDISYDVAQAAVPTSDGGYVMAATRSIPAYDGWLLKTDAVGDTLWSRVFDSGTGDEFYSVVQTSDGGYAMTGIGGENGDVWVVKTEANGDLEWETFFGGDNLDYGFSIGQTADGGYFVGGYTQSFGAGSTDALLLRLGGVETSILSETPGAVRGPALFANYPNPYSGVTRIEYSLEAPTNIELTVIDLHGRILRTLVDGFEEPGRRSVEWDGTTSTGLAVPSGAYIYRLRTENGVQTRMMTVVR